MARGKQGTESMREELGQSKTKTQQANTACGSSLTVSGPCGVGTVEAGQPLAPLPSRTCSQGEPVSVGPPALFLQGRRVLVSQEEGGLGGRCRVAGL